MLILFDVTDDLPVLSLDALLSSDVLLPLSLSVPVPAPAVQFAE
jgi:hypothetical protein